MIAIVLFAKNEEKIIARTLDELNKALRQIPALRHQLFLCDDSEDQTAEIARGRGVTIIPGSGKGLGWSYYLALYLLAQQPFEAIITADSDGQADWSEIPYFYKEFKKGYDLVVGSRFLKAHSISYNYSWINFIGVKILSFIITVSALKKFTDSHGGLRIISASAAKDINFLGGYSYVQETIIDLALRGFQIKELPSKWSKRAHGKSRVVHSRLKYMRAMAAPLFLRMKIHWPIALGGGALLLYFLSPSYLYLLAFGLWADLYKILLFKKNKWAIIELAKARRLSKK